MPWSGGRAPHYQGSPCSIGPVYQQTAQQYQYHPPSSGPHRTRHRNGRQKTTEAQYTNQKNHVSSGRITRDWPTAIHLGHTQMDALNTRDGGVSRPPSRNPRMHNNDATRYMRIQPYTKDRAARTWRKERSDNVDLSVFEVPISVTGGRLI